MSTSATTAARPEADAEAAPAPGTISRWPAHQCAAIPGEDPATPDDELVRRRVAWFDAYAERSPLLWGTGREDVWTVDILVDGRTPPAGFRRAIGPIRVTAGQLHLTNYESLTMAAQFHDVRLPEPHLQDLVFELPPGMYGCDVGQLDDPDGDIEDSDDSRTVPDFVLTFTTAREVEPWREPAWHEG